MSTNTSALLFSVNVLMHLVCTLQGSWLRSRRCDTGYTSFFCINLHQAEWNEAAWQPYLQPGDVLQLRGTIWNVR
jgi:hypothetical protein